METKQKFYGRSFILTAILALTFGLTARAQSTDIDNPTPLTSNVIEGEHEGETETLYYSFTATKGDVKITFDGKTKYYSGWVKVELLNEDGSSELFKIDGMATSTSKRTAGTKRFLREQKVILRVSIEKDAVVGLINYKIRLDGAVKFEAPPAGGEAAPPATEAAPPTEETAPPAEATNSNPPPTTAKPSPTTTTTTGGEQTAPKKATTKERIKAKTKTEAKKILKDVVDN